jgi:hypothetical protein
MERGKGVWTPAFAGVVKNKEAGVTSLVYLQEKRQKSSHPLKDKGLFTGYSVGKVQAPARKINSIPADAFVSIEQEFWVCQGENVTLFKGI